MAINHHLARFDISFRMNSLPPLGSWQGSQSVTMLWFYSSQANNAEAVVCLLPNGSFV